MNGRAEKPSLSSTFTVAAAAPFSLTRTSSYEYELTTMDLYLKSYRWLSRKAVGFCNCASVVELIARRSRYNRISFVASLEATMRVLYFYL